MSLSAKDLWKRVLESAKRDLPEPMIQTWLAPNAAISFEDGLLLISTPDDFAKRWNDEKYAAVPSSKMEHLMENLEDYSTFASLLVGDDVGRHRRRAGFRQPFPDDADSARRMEIRRLRRQ